MRAALPMDSRLQALAVVLGEVIVALRVPLLRYGGARRFLQIGFAGEVRSPVPGPNFSRHLIREKG